MKNLSYIVVFLLGLVTHAQTGLYHAGNMQVHANAQVGLHTSFINDAPFDQNLGLVGFYGNGILSLQGNVSPVFYDFEISATNGIDLEVATNVSHSANFIFGDVRTPKAQPNVYLGILDDALYTGESDFSKVAGFALTTNQAAYSFPVGDAAYIRPLILVSQSTNLTAKCAYYFENPNMPISFASPFETDKTERQLDLVNAKEFWKVEGSVPSKVELSWNGRSDIGALTEVLENLLVVGWSKANQEWEILGNTGVSGDLNNGMLFSDTFIPDAYEVVTIGSLLVPQDRLTIPNFYLSPNGDGINDALVIEELALSPNNTLNLYDRNGLLVFQKDNYTDEFIGIANTDNRVINKAQGLPGGIYFYVVDLLDLGYEFQGFLYLAR